MQSGQVGMRWAGEDLKLPILAHPLLASKQRCDFFHCYSVDGAAECLSHFAVELSMGIERAWSLSYWLCSPLGSHLRQRASHPGHNLPDFKTQEQLDTVC